MSIAIFRGAIVSALAIVASSGPVGCNRAAAPAPPSSPSSAPSVAPMAAETVRAEQPACTRPWMTAWVEAHDVVAKDCRRFDLDGDGQDEAVLQACGDEGHRAAYLVARGDEHWAIEHHGWGHVPVCTEAALVPAAGRIVLHDTGPGEIEAREVAFRDGRLAVVHQRYDIAQPGGEALGRTLDFERSIVARRASNFHEGCPHSFDLGTEGAVLVVGGLPVQTRWVVDGEPFYHGATDGRLEARASAATDGVKLAISIEDDEPTAGDSVVIRWATADALATDPLGCGDDPKMAMLTISAAADGSLRTAVGGALISAKIEGEPRRFTVELSAQSLGVAAAPWEIPLTIEYVDADASGTARLSTSRFATQEPVTLGALRANAGGGRYPAIGARLP